MVQPRFYPQNNFLSAIKADDLTEQEIAKFFVEPVDLLRSTLVMRQHYMLLGGRGAGKTITLRKLSHTLSNPTPTFPFLGVYITFDLSQCAPFLEDKIGAKNGFLFEAFIATLLMGEVLKALAAHKELFEYGDHALANRIKVALRLPDDAGDSCEELVQYLGSLTDALRNVANVKLTSSKTTDVQRLFTVSALNDLCGIIAQALETSIKPFTSLFLLDRYGDLSPFQQSIANTLFGLPSPRHFYVRASLKPESLQTYEMYLGGTIAEPQDFRVIDLDNLLDEPTYLQLLRAIVQKRLLVEREKDPELKVRPNLDDLVVEQPPEGLSTIRYAGIRDLTKLSDHNIYNFLYLLEKCVEHADDPGSLRSGGQLSVESQHRAAKKVAEISYNGIASSVEGDRGVVQYLTSFVLKEMSAQKAGPLITFRGGKQSKAEPFLRLALRESIFRQSDIEPEDPDDWQVELNRILLPRNDLPLTERQPLVIHSNNLKKIIADAVAQPSRRKSPTQQQQGSFWPITVSDPLLHYPQSLETFARNHLSRFLKDNRKNTEFLLRSMEYADSVVAEAKRTLEPKIYETFGNAATNLAVGLAGSFARREAVERSSDADLFVVGNISTREFGLAKSLLDYCSQWFREREIEAPDLPSALSIDDAPFQPFPAVIDTSQIIDQAAKSRDFEENRTRRMCLVTESVCIFNQSLFETCRNSVLTKLDAYEYIGHQAVPLTFLREFVYWCESFRSRIELEKKTGVKYDKRKLQRLFMHKATLLACMAHVSQGEADTFNTLLEVFEMAPALRLHHVVTCVPESIKSKVSELVAEAIESYNTDLSMLITLKNSVLSPASASIQKDCENVLEHSLSGLEEALRGTLGHRHRTSFAELHG